VNDAKNDHVASVECINQPIGTDDPFSEHRVLPLRDLASKPGKAGQVRSGGVTAFDDVGGEEWSVLGDPVADLKHVALRR